MIADEGPPRCAPGRGPRHVAPGRDRDDCWHADCLHFGRAWALRHSPLTDGRMPALHSEPRSPNAARSFFSAAAARYDSSAFPPLARCPTRPIEEPPRRPNDTRPARARRRPRAARRDRARPARARDHAAPRRRDDRGGRAHPRRRGRRRAGDGGGAHSRRRLPQGGAAARRARAHRRRLPPLGRDTARGDAGRRRYARCEAGGRRVPRLPRRRTAALVRGPRRGDAGATRCRHGAVRVGGAPRSARLRLGVARRPGRAPRRAPLLPPSSAAIRATRTPTTPRRRSSHERRSTARALTGRGSASSCICGHDPSRRRGHRDERTSLRRERSPETRPGAASSSRRPTSPPRRPPSPPTRVRRRCRTSATSCARSCVPRSCSP